MLYVVICKAVDMFDIIALLPQQYLTVPDKTRDAAGYALSRFMTRPDVKKDKLPEFLDWLLVVMKTSDSKENFYLLYECICSYVYFCVTSVSEFI